MKRFIHTLQDTLAFQLQGLYFGESRFREEAETLEQETTSASLRMQIMKYRRSTANNIVRIERIFDYLMQEPEIRRDRVITSLLDEGKALLGVTDSTHLKDIVVISLLQNINAYKITCLKTAYMFATELEMDTASDILQQLLELELETSKALSGTAIDEFNKGPELAPV